MGTGERPRWRASSVRPDVKAPAVATNSEPSADDSGSGPLGFIVNALTAKPRVRVQRTVTVNGVVVTRTGARRCPTRRSRLPRQQRRPLPSPAKSPTSRSARPLSRKLRRWPRGAGRLAAAGVSPADQEIVLKKSFARYALDRKRLTAVYQMDAAELDKLLPLEIVPQPKKISRIALVIVTQIDPAIGDDLDRLIAQLGNPDWKLREAAMSEIRKLGNIAKPRCRRP